MTRRMKTFVYVVAGSIVLSCALCGGCVYQGFREMPKARAASDAFMDLLAAGKIDDAYASTSPAFKAVTTPEKFQGAINGFAALKNQAGRAARTWRIYNMNQAQIAYFIPNPPNPLTITINLTKSDEGWKVFGFNAP